MINVHITYKSSVPGAAPSDHTKAYTTRLSLLEVLAQLGVCADQKTPYLKIRSAIEGYVIGNYMAATIKVQGSGAHFTFDDQVEICLHGRSEYHTLKEIRQLFYRTEAL